MCIYGFRAVTVGTGASGVRGDLRAFRPAVVALRVIIADVPAPFPLAGRPHRRTPRRRPALLSRKKSLRQLMPVQPQPAPLRGWTAQGPTVTALRPPT